MVLNPDLTLQSSVNPMMTLGREFWRLMLLDKVRPRSDYREESWDVTVAHEVEVIQGDCLLVRREALPSAHVLDEAYFMYTEEVDLCYRLLQAGWLLYWVPMARIIHYGGQSTRQVRKEMFVQLYRSKVLFFRKNKGAWAGQLYKSMLFVVALMRVLWGSLSLQRAGSPSDERFHLYRDLLRAFPSL
jgi:GT2 family glycosyltransferase